MTRFLALTALLTVAIVMLPAVPSAHAAEAGAGVRVDQTTVSKPPTAPLPHFTAAPSAFSGELFPCSDCHAGMTPDFNRRELRDEHAAIVLQHTAGQLWCLDCHQALNRDNLRLANGESIPFTASYRLCGQCHGEKLRNWQSGLHGKRTGHWNGEKVALLCTHCHDPHAPKFKALKPLPPPERPGRTGY